MTDAPPIGEPPPPSSPNSGSPPPPPFPGAGDRPQQFQGSGWGAFKKWLGPEGYAKFEASLCESISRQINKDKEQQQKASRRLKRSETGESDD